MNTTTYKLILIALLFISCKEVKDTNNDQKRVWELADIPTLNFYEFEPMLTTTSDKVQVINFWATWCAPCVEEMPYFEALADTYKKEIDLKFISLDMPEHKASKVLKFAIDKNIQNDIILLDDTRSHYWIPKVDQDWSGAIPATLIVTKDQKAFYEQPFTQDELANELKKFIP